MLLIIFTNLFIILLKKYLRIEKNGLFQVQNYKLHKVSDLYMEMNHTRIQKY